MSFDLDSIRAQFPALAKTDDGLRRIYFDNPAGTQVPTTVVEAMSDCLLNRSANLGGPFASSIAADEVVAAARLAMADFINAPEPEEIIFGQNMTTMTLHLSRSLGQMFNAGDEIILSQMDHDANVWPWVLMARDFDLEIRWLSFETDTFEFDLEQLDALLSKRTKLVCVGGASNLTGTVNDVRAICAKAKAAGALTYIDAVQSAPHVVSDVQEVDCDFFVCSAYKFFGPHQGILWGRRVLLEELSAYKVRPAPDEIPWKFETGTQSHEGIAGCMAAVDYFAEIGATMAESKQAKWQRFSERRRDVCAALDLLFDYEKLLAERLIDGLQDIPGVQVLGITSPDALERRVPTVSFRHREKSPQSIAMHMAEANIFVWNGHNYAVEVAQSLGILDSGGAVRVGPVHYNSVAEIDEFLSALQDCLG